MTASKPDVVITIMEELMEDLKKLSSQENRDEDKTEERVETSSQESRDSVCTDVQDEDGRSKTVESLDVFGGKPMEDYPRSLFTANKPTVEKAFVRAVASYFAYHVLRTSTRKQHTTGYLHDNWRRMCLCLDEESIRLLFYARLKEDERMYVQEFQDMWKAMHEKLVDNEFNCLQRHIAAEVRGIVRFTRVQR